MLARKGAVSKGGVESITTPTSSSPLNLAPGSDSSISMMMDLVPALTSAMRSFHQPKSFSWLSGGRKVPIMRSYVMHWA